MTDQKTAKAFSEEELFELIEEYGLSNEWDLTDDILLRLLNTPFEVLDQVNQKIKANPGDFEQGDSQAEASTGQEEGAPGKNQALALKPAPVPANPELKPKPQDVIRKVRRLKKDFQHRATDMRALEDFYSWVLRLDSEHAYTVAAGLSNTKLAKNPKFAAIISYAFCIKNGFFNDAARQFEANLPGSSVVKKAQQERSLSQGVALAGHQLEAQLQSPAQVNSASDLFSYIQKAMQPRLEGAAKKPQEENEFHPVRR